MLRAGIPEAAAGIPEAAAGIPEVVAGIRAGLPPLEGLMVISCCGEFSSGRRGPMRTVSCYGIEA